MTGVDFDLDAHRRNRLRDADRRIESLIVYRAQLERILPQALVVASAGTGVTPGALLDVLERTDDIVSSGGGPEESNLIAEDRLLELLGDAPGLPAAAAAISGEGSVLAPEPDSFAGLLRLVGDDA